MRVLHNKMASRRGKKQTETPAAPVQAPVVEEAPVPVAAVAPPPPAAKKGKKPVKVVAVVTQQGIQGTFSSEPRRPLIAHLQIHSNEVKFNDNPLQYDPNPPTQPVAYDPIGDNVFTSHQEEFELEAKEAEKQSQKAAAAAAAAQATETVVAAAEPIPAFTKVDLMVQYRECSTSQKLPDSVTIGCFWCTYKFTHRPCIIPEREEKGVYRVYGNFCCPECAVSYLLQESMDPHVRWERMALLHRIYDSDGKGRVFPAPARESLELFGGPMSIEQFRATIGAGKVRIDVHMPPMVSILGSIDTKPIDFFDTSLKNMMLHAPFAAASAAEKKADKGEEGLRLKRSKPLKDRDSTLDSVMNIQFRTR
jgi:hypothetical protein